MTSLRLDESPQYAFIEEAEYYALEEKAVVRHQYFDGEIFAMAGASPEHVAITLNLNVTVGSRLRGHSCFGAGSDQRVKIEATGLITYPDFAIICPPARYDPKNRNTLLNPRVVVEILSPSTARYDRTTKFENYKQIDSLSDYILIDQDGIQVEHHHRDESGVWQQKSYNSLEDVLSIPDLNLAIPLSEIYERLNLPRGLV